MLDIPTSSSMLFAGITQDEAKLMLPCLGATRRVFSREERIMRAGQPTEYLGIVLSGRVRIEVSDAWGETTILDILGPGSLFAHGYACSMEPLDIDVLADSACEVVLLKAERIIHPVSYTHLDVYKRQIVWFPWERLPRLSRVAI